jgi:aldose sugar dehydrogenase
VTRRDFSYRKLLSLTILISSDVILTVFAPVDTSGSIVNKGIIFTDPNLKAELIFHGFEPPRDRDDHSSVTKMAFLGTDDILVLEKNIGQVRRIVNGSLLPGPLLDVSVANERERGLLGIAVASYDNANNDSNIAQVGHRNKTSSFSTTYVFLYFTQSKISADGIDECPPPKPYYCIEGGEPEGNRIYRYELVDNGSKLIDPKLLLDLPAGPGPVHNGGDLLVGPENNIYIITGDMLSNYSEDNITETLNFENGTWPDGRGGVLRITQDGKTVGVGVGETGIEDQELGILGNTHPLNKYYAYGIRNSFGMDFDPITGNLWIQRMVPDLETRLIWLGLDLIVDGAKFRGYGSLLT